MEVKGILCPPFPTTLWFPRCLQELPFSRRDVLRMASVVPALYGFRVQDQFHSLFCFFLPLSFAPRLTKGLTSSGLPGECFSKFSRCSFQVLMRFTLDLHSLSSFCLRQLHLVPNLDRVVCPFRFRIPFLTSVPPPELTDRPTLSPPPILLFSLLV